MIEENYPTLYVVLPNHHQCLTKPNTCTARIHIYLYYKDRKQLKIFFSHIRPIVLITLGLPVRIEGVDP